MWYQNKSQFVIEDPLAERSWPSTLGLVQVVASDNGVTTTRGWGQNEFWENHQDGKFSPKKYLRRFEHGRPFGIIMRSVPYVCIDIDGKNGGIEASKILQLPPTLAETSKSGNGMHLFYRIPEAVWTEGEGYSEYGDSNGLIPGVDTRGTGIVYHYPSQRWNDKPIANLPKGLRRLLDAHKLSKQKRLDLDSQRLSGLDATIREDELIRELENHVFRSGSRNQWLFAWGCRAVPYVRNWRKLVLEHGSRAGLGPAECLQITEGVVKYGTPGDSKTR